MDYTAIIITLISSFSAIGVAFIGYHQYKERKDAELKEEGSALLLEMSQAGLNLSKCTAKAVMGLEVNGDMTEAMKWAKSVSERYDKYLRRIYQTKVAE